MRATVRTSPGPVLREDQLTRLLNLCQSELERKWVRLVDRMGLKLPSHGQYLVKDCGVRPDFLYEREGVAIFVDGPHHEYPERQERDRTQDACMEDSGWTIIRFGHRDNWQPIIEQHPNIFGAGR